MRPNANKSKLSTQRCENDEYYGRHEHKHRYGWVSFATPSNGEDYQQRNHDYADTVRERRYQGAGESRHGYRSIGLGPAQMSPKALCVDMAQIALARPPTPTALRLFD